MEKDIDYYSILVIEDDTKHFLNLEKLIHKRILNPKLVHVLSVTAALSVIPLENFDVILLSKKPAFSEPELVAEIITIKNFSKLILLWDNIDMAFARQILALGVSDYLLRKKLSSWLLYKSIVNVVEKNKVTQKLAESQKQYTDLFNLNPLPMWVYEVETLKFIRVNHAAVRKYGYSRKAFLKMTIKDIRPVEDIPILEKAVEYVKSHDKLFSSGLYKHKKKNGEVIWVELISNIMYIDKAKYELVLANDITERVKYLQEIHDQNKRLQDIAFTQSHIVRAPLANMIGLLQHINDEGLDSDTSAELLQHLLDCGNQLDKNIREIVIKTQNLNIPN